MRIITNNKINFEALKESISKPDIFEKSNEKFWDDPHISEQMLNYHLNPDIEAASKTRDTIEAETKFIIDKTNMNEEKSVLDLGCGPGLYVKEFIKTGARVTGIDLSERSIDYAKRMIGSECENVVLTKMNYLDMDYEDAFDIVTLIFYDFCALSMEDQHTLLSKIYKALKADGVFVLDVVSENKPTTVSTSISVFQEGFWSPKPYVEILNTYVYEDPKTEGLQYTIIEESGDTRIIRIYHRLFSVQGITSQFVESGFRIQEVFSNLKGDSFTPDSATYGIIARRI